MSYNLEEFKDAEYPMLKEEVYLDHGGTTLYARSAMDTFVKDMTFNLYGNPHSLSSSSSLSSERIEEVRARALMFFNADPRDFDIVFVQNATAAIKLVAEILAHSGSLPRHKSDRPDSNSYWYGYHIESHTSLIGVRELSEAGWKCFEDDEAVESWIKTGCLGHQHALRPSPIAALFAYPGQSNMTGRRLPLSWPGRLRRSSKCACSNVYTLLDAAALASTAVLDLGDADAAPDFTVVSFYKIFGFPDLGALIVRRALGPLLEQRRYFGGGTVEMAVGAGDQWHARKVQSPHECLEDGTLPFHNIIALGHSLTAHKRLFKSQNLVSEYTTGLALHLYRRLSSLQHSNGHPICVIYKHPSAQYGDSRTQGPTIAFNIRDFNGRWVRLSVLDHAANNHRIHLRTGDVCNPGGVAKALDLDSWELFRNYAAGLRCGCKNIVIGGKPSGIARVGLGAMSSMQDIECLVNFIEKTFRDYDTTQRDASETGGNGFVNTILIYPIDGCRGWSLRKDEVWEVGPRGLKWDREWCIIDLEEGVVLTQRTTPRLALIHPEVDDKGRILTIKLHRSLWLSPRIDVELRIPLQIDTSSSQAAYESYFQPREVFYDESGIRVWAYLSEDIVSFFSAAMKTRCTIAKFVPASSGKLVADLPAVPEPNSVVSMGCLPVTSTLQGSMQAISNVSYRPSHEFNLTRVGEFFTAPSKPPQEVLAESMMANIVLGDRAEIMNPRLDDKWLFMDLGGHLTKVDNPSLTYQLSRVRTDALPKRNINFLRQNETQGLRKLIWGPEHQHSNKTGFKIAIGQQVTFGTDPEAEEMTSNL